MSSSFRPYEGDRPYVYACYSQTRYDDVADTLRILHEHRCRVWFDEGIPCGRELAPQAERRLRACGCVIFFLSADSISSPICYSEIKTATLLKKHIIVVRLDPSPLPDYWAIVLRDSIYIQVRGSGSTDRRLSAAGRAALAASQLSLAVTPDDLAGAILSSHQLTGIYFRRRLEGIDPVPVFFVLSALLLMLSAGLLYGLLSGRIRIFGNGDPSDAQISAPPVDQYLGIHGEVDREKWMNELTGDIVFPDELQEKAVRSRLSDSSPVISEQRLIEIEELYFCGNMTADRAGAISVSDGIWAVNTAAPGPGVITDLSLIHRMPCLKALWLDLQPLKDISGLSDHLLLGELSLAGCGQLDLAQLSDLPSLETLHLEYSGIRDLTPLRNLPSLRTVTVSADMVPLTWGENASFDVVLVK